MTIPGSYRLMACRRLLTGEQVLAAVALVAFVGIWWFFAVEVVSRHDLITPPDLVRAYGRLVSQGYYHVSLAAQVWASLRRCLLGFAIGASIAIPVGLLSGYYRAVGAAISPIMAVLRPIPAIAYFPLLVVFLGIGETSKVYLIAVAAFSWTLLNTAAGVRNVPRQLVLTGEMLGLTRPQVFASVVFRAALPQIMTGLNVSLVISWGTVIAAELIAATTGLGFMATDAATYFRVEDVYAAIGLIGAIGALFELTLRTAERRLLPWVGKD
jgi:ABC-type nitrate/sulfonate/bicarbonate transport system permease component